MAFPPTLAPWVWHNLFFSPQISGGLYGNFKVIRCFEFLYEEAVMLVLPLHTDYFWLDMVSSTQPTTTRRKMAFADAVFGEYVRGEFRNQRGFSPYIM
jgi:hypothetical protein